MQELTDRIQALGFTLSSARDVSLLANIKRFRERWNGDPEFRRSFPGDPQRVARNAGLKVDLDDVRPYWDPQSQGQATPAMERYLAFLNHRVGGAGTSDPADSRFARWRDRQCRRLHFEVPSGGYSKAGNHLIAAAFELSRGCSVGCWFCSASPPKLTDLFRYTPANARLWREILTAVCEVSGPDLARNSICYKGTDPLDNPDYEQFIGDFADVNGALPGTSTALAVRDPERTRRLLAKSGSYVRFSVLSVGMLNRIHQAFTPEELLLVILGFRNEGSLSGNRLHLAGRARENSAKYRKFRPDEPLLATPTCVSGFSFNLVDRTIQLISPCVPDDRWPQGTRVYDEARFEDAADVRRVLEEMIARNMPAEVAGTEPLRFQRHLAYERTAVGFNVKSGYQRQRFEETPETPFLGRLGALVHSGRCTLEQIVETLAAEAAAPAESVRLAVNRLFRAGVLDDEPAVSGQLLAIGQVASA
jgi:radical SAM family RiPP maturation amino acid epimerase